MYILLYIKKTRLTIKKKKSTTVKSTDFLLGSSYMTEEIILYLDAFCISAIILLKLMFYFIFFFFLVEFECNNLRFDEV